MGGGALPETIKEDTMRTVFVLAICAVAAIVTPAGAQDIDWKKVDEAAGRTAAVTGDVHRYGFPRSDPQGAPDGVALKPPPALGSWAALNPAPRRATPICHLA